MDRKKILGVVIGSACFGAAALSGGLAVRSQYAGDRWRIVPLVGEQGFLHLPQQIGYFGTKDACEAALQRVVGRQFQGRKIAACVDSPPLFIVEPVKGRSVGAFFSQEACERFLLIGRSSLAPEAALGIEPSGSLPPIVCDMAKQVMGVEDFLASAAADAVARSGAPSGSAAETERIAQLAIPEDRKVRPHQSDQEQARAEHYMAAIQTAVVKKLRQSSSGPVARCTLKIVQIPGGDVISVRVAEPCAADRVVRYSLERAVMEASPLPYVGYESVFSRTIELSLQDG